MYIIHIILIIRAYKPQIWSYTLKTHPLEQIIINKMSFDLQSETDVKDYIEKLGIEYRFGCYSEKKPDGIYHNIKYNLKTKVPSIT